MCKWVSTVQYVLVWHSADAFAWLDTCGSLLTGNCSPALCSQLGTSEGKQGEGLRLPVCALCSDPPAGCGEQGPSACPWAWLEAGQALPKSHGQVSVRTKLIVGVVRLGFLQTVHPLC